MEKNKFEQLLSINVNEYVEEKVCGKTKLKYLSWSYAWSEFKKNYSDAIYSVVKFDGKPYMFDEDLGYMVETSITADGETHPMWLPVLDGKNKAMKNVEYTYNQMEYGKPVEKTVNAATMFDINTTIMRCLVKNIAMFGLGLYIYNGDDVPPINMNDLNEKINNCSTKEELVSLYNTLDGRDKNNQEFISKFSAKKNEII